MADEAKTATEATQDNKPKAKSEKVSGETAKVATATFNKDEANEVSYKTTGNFQLYDVVTGTLFTQDKATKASDSNPFVVTHLERKNLKKA